MLLVHAVFLRFVIVSTLWHATTVIGDAFLLFSVQWIIGVNSTCIWLNILCLGSLKSLHLLVGNK